MARCNGGGRVARILAAVSFDALPPMALGCRTVGGNLVTCLSERKLLPFDQTCQWLTRFYESVPAPVLRPSQDWSSQGRLYQWVERAEVNWASYVMCSDSTNVSGHGRKEALVPKHTFWVFCTSMLVHMYIFIPVRKAVHYSIPKSFYG